MLFSRKGKLRKEFDERLVSLIKETKDELNSAKVFEGLADDYNLDIVTQRKIAESLHFYLFKEAKIRRVTIK